MKGRAIRHMAGAGAVLLVFLGVWLGHTLEYMRLNGAAGLERATLTAPHAYMLPLGALLAVLLAGRGVRWWRRWTALGDRLEQAHRALRALLHGDRPALPPVERTASASRLHVPLLWVPLALCQIALYLVQENAKSVAGGRPLPWLEPVTGVHWAAPLVHAAVALVLASAVAIPGRRLWRRAARLLGCERLVAHLGRLRAGISIPRVASAGWRPSPLERFGSQLWSRPPPA